MACRALPAALLLTGLAAGTAAAGRAYLDGPPPRHTGGFREPTCAACHFDNPVDAPGGALLVHGLPAELEPGRSYRVTIELVRDGMQRAGFQAAIRHADGARAARQAGSPQVNDERVAITEADSVAYLHHTLPGSLVHEGAARWTFEWTAPADGAGDVVLHVAANAANGDNSEFGDHIYLKEVLSRFGR